MEHTIHLLAKFSDQLGFTSDTIAEHNKVIKDKGAVWFGKLGRRLGKEPLECLNQQCAHGIPTYLYLVQRREGTFQVFRGNVLEMTYTSGLHSRHLIPAYYQQHRLTENIHFWVRLSHIKRVNDGESALSKLILPTTGFPILRTLLKSMNPMFVVRSQQ